LSRAFPSLPPSIVKSFLLLFFKKEVLSTKGAPPGYWRKMSAKKAVIAAQDAASATAS
jgi:hypothetical protein